MPSKPVRIPPKLQPWIEVCKRFHLSHAQIQMARELGLNPKKFGGLANHRQEPWKAPLSEFIETLYFKRFKKSRPDQVRQVGKKAESLKTVSVKIAGYDDGNEDNGDRDPYKRRERGRKAKRLINRGTGTVATPPEPVVLS